MLTTASVTNYVVTGDVLNEAFSGAFGETIYLPQQVFFDEKNVREATWYNKLARIYDTKKEQLRVAINNHYMESVISALKEKRYK